MSFTDPDEMSLRLMLEDEDWLMRLRVNATQRMEASQSMRGEAFKECQAVLSGLLEDLRSTSVMSGEVLPVLSIAYSQSRLPDAATFADESQVRFVLEWLGEAMAEVGVGEDYGAVYQLGFIHGIAAALKHATER